MAPLRMGRVPIQSLTVSKRQRGKVMHLSKVLQLNPSEGRPQGNWNYNGIPNKEINNNRDPALSRHDQENNNNNNNNNKDEATASQHFEPKVSGQLFLFVLGSLCSQILSRVQSCLNLVVSGSKPLCPKQVSQRRRGRKQRRL